METIAPWLSLKAVPGIGNHLFKRLIQRFRTPEAVFSAHPSELSEVEGIHAGTVSAIRGHRTPDWIPEELSLVRARGYRIIVYNDPEYPPLLREIPDPPPYLYVHGAPSPAANAVALVGSRNASRYGIMSTKRLAEELAAMGIVVVSGMAKGVDTAAHIGAMAGGGRTLAVLGSGLDRIYPAENTELFHKIAETGAVLSEFPMPAAPEPHHFPVRNRIISGISLGTVVVEAAGKSGSLITARLAAEQNREVFAVPGNIQSSGSEGTHRLIKQGAKLVEGVPDILEELAHLIEMPSAEKTGPARGAETPELPLLSPEESVVVKALGPEPIHIDDLTRATRMPAGLLSSTLLQLELRNIVQQFPGKRFARWSGRDHR